VLYSNEIEALYAAVEKAESGDTPLPDSWFQGDLEVWLTTLLGDLVGRPVSSDKDVFEQGADR
jgi:hypothetical protein